MTAPGSTAGTGAKTKPELTLGDILDEALTKAKALASERQPHPCDEGCQYAKDVGMWPEHSCGLGCIYDDRGPWTSVDAPPDRAGYAPTVEGDRG